LCGRVGGQGRKVVARHADVAKGCGQARGVAQVFESRGQLLAGSF
jgi:hypothetical protein